MQAPLPTEISRSAAMVVAEVGMSDQADALQRARAFATPLLQAQTLDTGENLLAHADAVADILRSIGGSPAMQAAAYLVYAGEHLQKPRDVIARAFDDNYAELAVQTSKLVALQRQARKRQASEAAARRKDPQSDLMAAQTENIRKMLLAFSKDVRVVMLRCIIVGVDGRAFMRFDNDHRGDPKTWPFSAPHWLLLNVAVGGWGGQKGIDRAAFPARMEVDYVRVYQKKD